jgi:hypothetical protein
VQAGSPRAAWRRWASAPFCGRAAHDGASAARPLAVGDIDGNGTTFVIGNTDVPFGYSVLFVRQDSTFGSLSNFALTARPMRDHPTSTATAPTTSRSRSRQPGSGQGLAPRGLAPSTLWARSRSKDASTDSRPGRRPGRHRRPVACLTDSASTPYRGGLKVLRGGARAACGMARSFPARSDGGRHETIARRVSSRLQLRRRARLRVHRFERERTSIVHGAGLVPVRINLPPS